MPLMSNSGRNPTGAGTEAVCIHTRKIYDSCRAKDCAEDVRVFLTQSSFPNIQGLTNIRTREAQLLWVSSQVEELPFNRGYYTVDLSYFYRLRFDACQSGVEGTAEGLAIFTKRVILFGSEGSVKVFSSDNDDVDPESVVQPIAVVEAVDPVILRVRISDTPLPPTPLPCIIPPAVLDAFPEAPQFENDSRLVVSLGQFSIVRLERDTQLSIPCYDYCIPDESCDITEEEDPCTLFSRINFPTDEFFPPNYIADTRFGRPYGTADNEPDTEE